MIWEKQSVVKLRLLKVKVPKRMRDIDLRRTHAKICAISEKVTLKEEGGCLTRSPEGWRAKIHLSSIFSRDRCQQIFHFRRYPF
jgi:hypothetical protein